MLAPANPEWAGKLGIAPGETDFQPIITSIADTHAAAAALAWLKAVRANAGSHGYQAHELHGTGELSGSVAEVTVLIRPEQVVLTPVAARHAATAEGATGGPAIAWPATEGTC